MNGNIDNHTQVVPEFRGRITKRDIVISLVSAVDLHECDCFLFRSKVIQ